MMANELRLGALILAAGASRRMGGPKMLLRWNNSTVLHHLILQWTGIAGDQVAAMCAAGDEGIAAELSRIGFPAERTIINGSPEGGMFSSIRAAARWDGWKSEVTHIAIALGDQPHLAESTLRETVRLAFDHPSKICQPSRHGRARHPVIMPRRVFTELGTTTSETLKAFLEGRSGERALIEISDPGLDLDLDTPADYRAALDLQAVRDKGQ